MPYEATFDILRELQADRWDLKVVVFPDGERGMIAVEQGPAGRELAGRTAEGYFELLLEWIGRRGGTEASGERERDTVH